MTSAFALCSASAQQYSSLRTYTHGVHAKRHVLPGVMRHGRGRSAFSKSGRPTCSRPNHRVAALRMDARSGAGANQWNDQSDGVDENEVEGEVGASGWAEGLEAMLEEALLSFYEGAPLFSEAEFQTLRDELEHLGASSVRLSTMEKVWVAASQERDFDRRLRKELELSPADLDEMKDKLLIAARKRREDNKEKRIAEAAKMPGMELFPPRQAKSFGLNDAQIIDSSNRVDERLRWLLFGDATEERLKIVLLYLPAVLMSFVTATFFTVLFALLDGEMRIYVSSVGRVRLGIMSYIVVACTFWFSNKVTPATLEFLDLGKPQLMRGLCPNCQASVSCLFSGGTRVRDERKCGVCGATVGFNKKWKKVYMVSPPGARKYSKPD